MSNIEIYIMLMSGLTSIVVTLVFSIFIMILLQMIIKPAMPKKYQHLSIAITLIVLILPATGFANLLYDYFDFYMRGSIIEHPTNLETYLMYLDKTK